jgi:hypothetical protein
MLCLPLLKGGLRGICFCSLEATAKENPPSLLLKEGKSEMLFLSPFTLL